VARELPITLNRTIKSGDFGADAFLRIPAGNGTFAVGSNPANTGTAVINTGSLNDSRQLIDNALSGFNQSLESLSTVRSRIGARLQVVETSRSENDAVNIQLEHTRSDLEDTDMTEAVVRLENQSTTLELLYKSFQRVDSLSLFDYL